MAIPTVESCCACIPLRTGTLILAYLYLVGTVIGIATSVLTILGGMLLVNEEVESKTDDFGFQYVYDSSTETVTGGATSAHQSLGYIAIAIGVVLLIIFVGKFVFSVFLVVGGHQGKPRYIKAYLIYASIILVVTILLNMNTLIYSEIIEIVAYAIFYVLEIYFLIVIRSHMLQLINAPVNDIPIDVYKA